MLVIFCGPVFLLSGLLGIADGEHRVAGLGFVLVGASVVAGAILYLRRPVRRTRDDDVLDILREAHKDP
jgi:hypothetical protein